MKPTDSEHPKWRQRCKAVAATGILLMAAGCGDNDRLKSDSRRIENQSSTNVSSGTRVETLTRSNAVLIRTIFPKNGNRLPKSKGYYVAGDLIMVEADEDGDGVLETLSLYNPRSNEMEVFIRGRNGSLSPVEAAALSEHKKLHKELEQFWENAFERSDKPK